MFDDRRKKQRRLANLTGLVRAGQDVDSVVTTDVSASGAFVATRLQLREGDEVELQLRDTLEQRRALRLHGTVVRAVSPGGGPQPGFGVRWRSADCAAGVEPLGDFLVNELDIEGAAIQVSEDGSRSRFEFPGALPLPDRPPESEPDRRPRGRPRPPTPVRTEAVSAPPVRPREPTPMGTGPVSPEPAPRAAASHIDSADDPSELVGIGGRAWFERMVEPSEVSRPGQLDVSRTDPGFGGGTDPQSGSIGRRLLSATGRLLGRGGDEPVPTTESRPTPRPAQPVAAREAAQPTRTAAAEVDEVDVPDVDVAAMVDVDVPVTYSVDEVLVPAHIRRLGVDGMVVDASGSVPFAGQATSMNLPFWLEDRYVTLRVRMVPCMDARVIGKVQRFVAAVLEIDDRHGVSMPELVAAERVEPKRAGTPG